MAENSSDSLTYLLEIDVRHKDFLGQIRHWEQLKMATEAQSIWVKDFTPSQLESATLKSVPFVNLYESKENLLFLKGSLVPSKKMPALLWTPLEKALPLELEGHNHNFFGINQEVKIKLARSENEQKAQILLVDKKLAENYVLQASEIRLQPLKWVLLNSEEVLIFGEPLLPLDGKAFWLKDNFIFPVGYDLEFPLLSGIIREKLCTEDFIFFFNENEYTVLPKQVLKALSISSWRQTLNHLS